MARKGYTKIDNDLFSFLYSNELNASELKVLLFLIRYTKGFSRDTCRASLSYIAKGTNRSVETIRKSIKSLSEKGYISIEYPAIGSKAQVVKVLYKNCCISYTRIVPHDIQELEDVLIQGLYHQDIKEDIKDIHKRKEREKPIFPTKNINEMSFDEAKEWKEKLSEEDWDLFLEGKVWSE